MKSSIKKIICLLISVIMIVALFTACKNENSGLVDKPINSYGYKDGVIGENLSPSHSAEKSDGKSGRIGSFFSGKSSYDSAEMAEADVADGDEYYGRTDYEYDSQYSVGSMTASEWKDIDNLSEWFDKVGEEEWKDIMRTRKLYGQNLFVVRVSNGDDSIFNQKVELIDKSGNVIYAAKTGITGYAYLLCPDKSLDEIASIKVGEQSADISKDDIGKVKDFDGDFDTKKVQQIDLMLMIDTTGSMGDELYYLEQELADVVDRVAKEGEALSIKVSVNFYRDEGDEYVVKYFDFRDDIDDVIKIMKDQNADGGGDFPEAVHEALENAVSGHEWREDAVKLCLFVLDAPPHDESEIQGINSKILSSLEDASRIGIRMIPIVASGINRETEVLMRHFAVMTGGTYIYITNDSGIGNEHLEADVSEKKVEPLNECIIRVISEYCGLEYEAQKVFEPEESTTSNPNEPSLYYNPERPDLDAEVAD